MSETTADVAQVHETASALILDQVRAIGYLDVAEHLYGSDAAVKPASMTDEQDEMCRRVVNAIRTATVTVDCQVCDPTT